MRRFRGRAQPFALAGLPESGGGLGGGGFLRGGGARGARGGPESPGASPGWDRREIDPIDQRSRSVAPLSCGLPSWSAGTYGEQAPEPWLTLRIGQ